MYDSLLEEDAWVQGYGDKREAKGKGEATRQNIALVVRARFSNLEELIMDRVEQMQDLEVLQKILIAISTVQDEREARSYLQAL